MKRPSRLVVYGMCVLAATRIAGGAPIVSEDFAGYTAGSINGEAALGTGLTGNWSESGASLPDFYVGEDEAGTPAPGKAFYDNNGAVNTTAHLDANATNASLLINGVDTFYASFVVDASANTSGSAILGIQHHNSSDPAFGIHGGSYAFYHAAYGSGSGGASAPQASGGTVSAGEHRVVLRIDYVGGGGNSETATVWVDPVEESDTPVISYTATFINNGGANLTGIKLAGGSAGGQPISYGEIRVGKSWSDVVPAQAPVIDTLDPTNREAEVSIGSDLTASFDQSIVTNAGGTVTITNLTTHTLFAAYTVPDSALSVSGADLIIDPPDFDATSVYAVLISADAVKNSSGQFFAGIDDTNGWQFTTADVDTEPPTTNSFSPANGATNVFVGTNLTVTFSEELTDAIGPGTVVVTNLTSGGTVAYATSFSGAELELDPNDDLAPGDTYAVLIATNAIRDLVGNYFAGLTNTVTWEWSFTTDGTDPALSALSPSNGASDVAIGANLVATFSEDIQPGSGSIFLTNVTDGGAATEITVPGGEVSIDGATLTVNPGSDLLRGKQYAVLIDATAIEDLSGNTFAGITSTEAWAFETTHALARESFKTTASADDYTHGNAFVAAANRDVVVGNSGFSADIYWGNSTSYIVPVNDAPGGGLTHSGVSGALPGAVQFTTDDLRAVRRSLASSVPSAAEYFLSGLVRAAENFANNNSFFAMGFLDTIDQVENKITKGMHLGMFRNGSGELRLGAFLGGSTFDLGAAELDTTYQVVVRLQAGAGGTDAFDAWIGADGDGTLTAVVEGQAVETFAGVGDIGAFALQQNNDGAAKSLWADEMRFGTELGHVTSASLVPRGTIFVFR